MAIKAAWPIEPLAHSAFGGDQCAREAVTKLKRDERKEVEVREFPFEHEVDAEDTGGDDVQHADDPFGGRGDKIGGDGGGQVLNSLTEGIDTEPVGEGKTMELGADRRQTVGQVRTEMLDIANDRWKRENEEDAENQEDEDHETEHSDGTRRLPAEDAQLHDLLHDGHKDHGEERADIDDLQNAAESP